MNEILQKRIEEAAEQYAYTNWENDDYHEGAEEGMPFDPIGYLEKCFKEAATFALQNQWISVEEALPPKRKTTKGEELEESIPVFVRDNEGNYTSAWYSFYGKHWYMAYGEAFLKQSIYSKITHWMPIPKPKKGGEK